MKEAATLEIELLRKRRTASFSFSIIKKGDDMDVRFNYSAKDIV